MPKWNPYATRGLAAKMWYRPDGRPRSKLKGAVFGERLQFKNHFVLLTIGILTKVALSTIAFCLSYARLAHLMERERVTFLLYYLALVQQIDKTYAEHDFDSFDTTKEYFYKLFRALPQHVKDVDEFEAFIRLIEETIEAASRSQHHKDDDTPSSGTPLIPLPSAQTHADPAPGRGYLSHLKSDDPVLSALFTSQDPDPLQALHAIMHSYARVVHELFEQDLRKGTLVECAQAVVVGLRDAVTAIKAVGKRVGVIEGDDGFARSIMLMSAKEGKEKDEYESIG